MDLSWGSLQILGLEYNWLASLASIVITIALVALGRFLIFKIPAFGKTRLANHQENRVKFKMEKYRGRLKTSNQVALATNLFFFIILAPLITTFNSQPWWRLLVDVFVILMVYDFFYYMMHRFLFHGQGWLRKVHGVHHQARKEKMTSIDSLLLHPMEAFLGIALYMVVTGVYCFALGVQMHVITVIATTIIYTQINQINHVKIELDFFPFKTLHNIAHKHSLHHIDMHHGNFATITLFYDWLFGSYE